MDENLQTIYATKCNYAIHLHNLGFTPKKVDSYNIISISPAKVILDIGNNLEFHYSKYSCIKWFVC